jgi:two-component sensor histidine kinase
MAATERDDASIALERQAERHREIEHRAKNTLQLISSIVLLQGRRASEEAARLALRAIQQRVAAISVAHRHVTWDADSEQVELAALIREIASDLAGSVGREGVVIDLDLETLKISGRQAAPVALLVCEMVSNALRHAYPEGHEGRVQVALRRTPAGPELCVADQGVGMGGAAPSTGFGMTVAQLMAQQLRANLQVDATPPGVRLTVRLPRDVVAS